MKSLKRTFPALAAGLILASSASQAAPVTVMGDDLIFTYDDATQFGTVTVIGNGIFFFDVDFEAQSVGTQGTVIDSDFVNIGIEVKAGSSLVIDSFQLFELGRLYLRWK